MLDSCADCLFEQSIGDDFTQLDMEITSDCPVQVRTTQVIVNVYIFTRLNPRPSKYRHVVVSLPKTF